MTRVNIEQQNTLRGSQRQEQPVASFLSPASLGRTSSPSRVAATGVSSHLSGIDEEGLTDLDLDSRMRSIEGALRGLPEGSCLYQYKRVMSGFHLPRQAKYANQATEVFATGRMAFLEKTAAFRRIDLHWCLTLEPSNSKAFERKPDENATDTSRMLADLEKAAVILESHLGSSLGLKLLAKAHAFQFFSYLFNLRNGPNRASFSAIPELIGRSSRVPLPGIATIFKWASVTYKCFP